MREFELIIDEALKNGLGPEDRIPSNSQWLKECLGFRCGKGGLEVHRTLANPLPATVDMYYNWPFPQFISGEKWGLLIVRDSLVNQEDVVYSVSENHQTVTYIFSIDKLTFGEGSLMEVADFGEYAFMTNGVIMIYWEPATSTWTPIVASATIPMMRTVCNFKGQAVGGNVVSTWYDCDSRYYIWSKIGSIDFTPSSDNESGYRRCPYGGVIHHVRRLGDSVVGYSTKGITLMRTVSDPPTLDFKEICDIGILNQGAMNGSLDRHIFVGENRYLYEVTSEGVKNLGYNYYLSLLAGEDVIVSYNPAREDFYIGNSTKTFLLSPYGMTEIKQHPSTVWRRNKISYMLPNTVDADNSYICTEVFDMEFRGQKTIFSIESDVTLCEGVEAGVDCTNDFTSWNTEYYKTMNNQGLASIIASGASFRFRLKFDSIDNDARIGYIKARYKMTDLRGLRGVYAPGLRGQSR